MKKIKRILGGSILTSMLAVVAGGGSILAEGTNLPEEGKDAIDAIVGGGASDRTTTDLVQSVLNFLIVIAVGASVIFIVVGGIRYAISGGNQEKVTAAKNTIMYAIIGLIVALLAGVIVNFVFSTLQDEVITPTETEGES